MRSEDWAQLRYFTPREFKYPTQMGYEFMLWLDKVRQAADVPFSISSSYRTPAHNKRVRGSKGSAHCSVPCNSVDIRKAPHAEDPNWNYSRARIIMAALNAGCRRWGMYQDGSLHIDRAEDTHPAPRAWVIVDNPA